MNEEIQPPQEPSEDKPQIPSKIKEDIEKALGQLSSEPHGEKFTQVVREIMMTVVAHTSGQSKIDPATAKILVDSIDRDNQNKFEFLTQKQRDTAAASLREHELEVVRHKDRMTLAKPVIYVALLVILGTTASGIWLAANGHETLGASILAGVFSAVLGYLGGLGTANFFKAK